MGQSDEVQLSGKAAQLVERADIDPLMSHVEELLSLGNWGELEALRHACRLASQRGKQLWAVSCHIEYRLCLEAPGPWAALVLETASGRFSLGPLAEVAGSAHSWEQLAPNLHACPEAAMFAHERALRGEDLTGDPVARRLPEVLDLPLRVEAWEPAYALAEYKADAVEAAAPPLPLLEPPARLGPNRRRTGASASLRSDLSPGCGNDALTSALEDLARTWVSESNGRVEAVATQGLATDAIAALEAGAVAMAPIPPGTALATMAWTAASGGAHGRRRGAAAGRFDAWCVLAAMAGIGGDFARFSADLAAVAASAAWYVWLGSEGPTTGWCVRLAAEVRSGQRKGTALAVRASDDA